MPAAAANIDAHGIVPPGGHNWWCVLYPGLCSFAQGGYALPAENDLVCGQYILRFRLVDWAHRLTAQRQTVLLAG